MKEREKEIEREASQAKEKEKERDMRDTLKKLVDEKSRRTGQLSAIRAPVDEIHAEYHLAGEDETGPGSSDSGSDMDSDLELGDDDIPVTGFAVVSNKRNVDFHELFPIPEGDYLIEGGWFNLITCPESFFFLMSLFFFD